MSLLSDLNPVCVFRTLRNHWGLFKQLTKRNMHARYRGSFFGMAWSVAQPLMMLAVYTFVFTFAFKAKFGTQSGDSKSAFAIIMFCGMAMYNIFSEGVMSSSMVISNNPNFVKKVIFPLEILPIVQVVTTLLFGLIWFGLLFVGAVILLPGSLSWTMLLLPLTLAPLLIFTCGIGFFAASVGVFMRDVQHILSIVLQVLFFMTPIFYPISAIPVQFRWILQLNPLTLLIEETRKLFLYGQQPDYLSCLLALIGAWVVFQLGFVWFIRTKKGFADVI